MRDLLLQYFNYPTESIRTFYRLLVGDEIFFCQNYPRVTKRNSYTVLYEREGKFCYGMISQFFLVQKNVAAVIERLRIVSIKPFAEDKIEIVQVSKLENGFTVVDIHSIKKCVCVDLQEFMYVAFLARFCVTKNFFCVQVHVRT